MAQLTLIDSPAAWQRRTIADAAANALADRHYSRKARGTPGNGQVGPPGRRIVLVTPCERALWLTHWPLAGMALDGLDAWRCSIFRNEGAGLSSDLIRAAMQTTADLWGEVPPDGWLTWIDLRMVESDHPGYCFKRAGWWLDREWTGRHSTSRHLIRLRA
jgi:hypothetical protein